MENKIWQALIGFIRQNTTASPVLQGLQNRSRIEKNCGIVTFIEKTIQGTPNEIINLDEENRTVGSQVLARYQIDLYGEKAYDEISRLRTLFTDYEGLRYFSNFDCAPIMTTTIRNLTASTIINDEYYKRYSMDLLLSYRDNICVSSEFIDEINVQTQEVNNYGIIH